MLTIWTSLKNSTVAWERVIYRLTRDLHQPLPVHSVIKCSFTTFNPLPDDKISD